MTKKQTPASPFRSDSPNTPQAEIRMFGELARGLRRPGRGRRKGVAVLGACILMVVARLTVAAI